MLSRRQFLHAAAGAAAGAALPAPVFPGSLRRGAALTINGARLRSRLERLSQFGRAEGGTFESGVSRVAYSDADVAGRTWLLDEIKAAGLSPRLDPAGNVFVRWPAAAAGATSGVRRPILFGSHIDSVPSGGNFDGDLGTLSALEVIQACQAAGFTPRHPFEMVVWAHEESTAFGRGTAASRIVAGDLQTGDLDQVWNGLRRADGIRRIGGDPTRIEQAIKKPGEWHGYFELHIEQGGTLEKSRTPIGVVEGIVAIHRYDVTVTGFANHAGTTPMDERHDAMLAASKLVVAVNEVVRARPGRQVGTVGRIDVSPNSPNVIPGQALLSVELRDLSEDTLKALGEAIRQRAAMIAQETGTAIAMALASRNPPATAHPGMQKAINRSAERAGLQAATLPSGAGHDAQNMAVLCPMGMIFVPSIGGISHSPKERTSWEDCANGAAVLLGAVLDIDAKETID
jgi:N-carbamoyl-L-amino-acid hydrolase